MSKSTDRSKGVLARKYNDEQFFNGILTPPDYKSHDHRIAILPTGRLSLSKATHDYFNVIDNAKDYPCVIEVWRKINGRGSDVNSDSPLWHRGNIFISGSGDEVTYPMGTKRFFKHDQSWKDLFEAELIDYIKIEDFYSLSPTYRSNQSYCYK